MSTVDDGRANDREDGGLFAPGNRAGKLFVKGNSLGKGNPNARRQYELRQALLGAAEPRHVEGVYRVMLKAALEGDVAAAKLVLEYIVGRPAQALELSGPDGEPLGGDLAQLQAVIMGALAKFPEARFAVAAELRAVRDAGDPAEGEAR